MAAFLFELYDHRFYEFIVAIRWPLPKEPE